MPEAIHCNEGYHAGPGWGMQPVRVLLSGVPCSFFPLTKIKKRWFGDEKIEFERRVGRCLDRFTSRALVDEIFELGATGGISKIQGDVGSKTT